MREFAVVAHPAQRTAVLHARVQPEELSTFFGHALRQVLAAMEAQGTLPDGEPFAYYHTVPNGIVDVEARTPP